MAVSEPYVKQVEGGAQPAPVNPASKLNLSGIDALNHMLDDFQASLMGKIRLILSNLGGGDLDQERIVEVPTLCAQLLNNLPEVMKSARKLVQDYAEIEEVAKSPKLKIEIAEEKRA